MKILLVSPTQFGYLTDYHRYYDYLKAEGHDVRFICWEHARPRLHDNPYHVQYVSRQGSQFRRTMRLMQAVIDLDRNWNFDRVVINWFPLCTRLLLSIPNEKLYLDIRTVAVHPKASDKARYDYMMKLASRRFKNVSVISHAAAKQIGIKKYKLLPLGGASFEILPGNTERLTFLYVGTLHLRRMIEAVRGFHAFVNNNPELATEFIIAGDAIHHELTEIQEYIARYNLTNYIKPVGYVPQRDLPAYFEQADFGVCYIPITKVFDVQPATKVYEFLVNGIPVIATALQDNVKIFNESRQQIGVCINDTSESFTAALQYLADNRNVFNWAGIKSEFAQYEWTRVLETHLNTVLNLEMPAVVALSERLARTDVRPMFRNVVVNE